MVIVIIYLEEVYKKINYFLSQSDICSRAMDNSTTSGSVEELKEESNLIIYINGLILLIIWKVTVMCQVRLHLKHNRLEELVQQRL